ncbi:DNA-directed RNA polymerase subunit beta [Nocardia sp. R6R-6]|uniref:DNA-directed RNA polymerase subunit beta n=1 Tax=Nocardia sp. R6R-6 TaxID=3459303 RepID=UPI00403E027E
MDQTALADTPAARCAYYRHTCDLPAGVHPEIGRITVRAGCIGAITMPAALGERVQDYLTEHHIDLGPIICHERSKRWTFLTRPNLSDDVRLFAELFRLNVSIVPFGGEIALPSPEDVSARYRHWIVAPCNGFRPSGSSIIDAVRSCSGAQKR